MLNVAGVEGEVNVVTEEARAVLHRPSEVGMGRWSILKRMVLEAVPKTISDEVFSSIQDNLPEEEPLCMVEPLRGFLYHADGTRHSNPVRLDPDTIGRLLAKGYSFSPPAPPPDESPTETGASGGNPTSKKSSKS